MSARGVMSRMQISYEPESDDDYEWVHPCCGGPWSERPEGHYADCPAKQLERSKP